MPGPTSPQRPDGGRLSDPGRTRAGRHGRGLRGRPDLAGPPSGPEDPAGAGVGRPGGFSERLGIVCSPTLARFGRVDRSYSPRLPRVSFRRHFGALMVHALYAEGETPDLRSPPYVGSGPFAMAVPRPRVPGRYAEPRNVKNLAVHPRSWAIGSSTRAA
jgi:hypothetical protein